MGDKCEWKELDIENLPNDIGVKDKYDLSWGDKENGIRRSFTLYSISNVGPTLSGVLKEVELNNSRLYYRKRAQKAPTHEEIMTKWWCNGEEWSRVGCYKSTNQVFRYFIFGKWCGKYFFSERKFADIPPEAK